jgi:hypothetical protein
MSSQRTLTQLLVAWGDHTAVDRVALAERRGSGGLNVDRALGRGGV